MGRSNKGRLVAVSILLALAVLAACNGGGQRLTPAPGITSLCQPLAQAERYRYSLTYSLESPQPQGAVDESALGDPPFAVQPTGPNFKFSQQFDGAVENPDKVELIAKTPGTPDLHIITIGSDQWVLLGGQWNPSAGGATFFPPLGTCNAVLSGLDLTRLTPSADTIDGEKVLRYEVEGAELETAVMMWTAKSDMGRILKTFTVTLWLSEQGDVPVRIESRSVGTYPSGRELSMEVTLGIRDVDADDIEVKPPL